MVMSETQSETPRTDAQVYCFEEARYAGQIGDGVFAEFARQLERELTALKSPELPGDAKARIEEITNRVYEHKYQHGELNTLECITVALTELHAQHQREIVALQYKVTDSLEQLVAAHLALSVLPAQFEEHLNAAMTLGEVCSCTDIRYLVDLIRVLLPEPPKP
jgi:hypothetical protein